MSSVRSATLASVKFQLKSHCVPLFIDKECAEARLKRLKRLRNISDDDPSIHFVCFALEQFINEDEEDSEDGEVDLLINFITKHHAALMRDAYSSEHKENSIEFKKEILSPRPIRGILPQLETSAQLKILLNDIPYEDHARTKKDIKKSRIFIFPCIKLELSEDQAYRVLLQGLPKDLDILSIRRELNDKINPIQNILLRGFQPDDTLRRNFNSLYRDVLPEVSSFDISSEFRQAVTMTLSRMQAVEPPKTFLELQEDILGTLIYPYCPRKQVAEFFQNGRINKGDLNFEERTFISAFEKSGLLNISSFFEFLFLTTKELLINQELQSAPPKEEKEPQIQKQVQFQPTGKPVFFLLHNGQTFCRNYHGGLRFFTYKQTEGKSFIERRIENPSNSEQKDQKLQKQDSDPPKLYHVSNLLKRQLKITHQDPHDDGALEVISRGLFSKISLALTWNQAKKLVHNPRIFNHLNHGEKIIVRRFFASPTKYGKLGDFLQAQLNTLPQEQADPSPLRLS